MTARRIAPVTLMALVVSCSCAGSAYAATRKAAATPETTPSLQTAATLPRAAVDRAPSSPPLSTGAAGAAAPSAGEEGVSAISAAPPAEADPLVSNGLGSPSCKGVLASELSASARRNCETSGFAAAPAPTGDYGVDVHIDAGLLNAGSWGSSIVQDLFVTPLWMALVWAVHGLVVIVVKLNL